jgi:hypothetical protein
MHSVNGSTPDINTGDSARSHTHPRNCFDMYYRNVKGLRTKQLELYENVCSTNYNIICLTETWLNNLCYDNSLLPDCYTVFLSESTSVAVEYSLPYPPESAPIYLFTYSWS